MLNDALVNGVLEVVVFLWNQGHRFNQDSILYAIRSRSIPCLRYVLEQGFTYEADRTGFYSIPRSIPQPHKGDIEMIEYCVTNRIPEVLIIEACRVTALLGNGVLLRRLYDARCPWDVTVCAAAAGAGHLNCLMYAHENGAPWDEETCVAAAKGKRIECLTYAIENGCPGDARVSNIAIQNDDYEMLVFAHENLLPWEDDMCMLAALRGSLRCLQYVHEAGCALTAETCSVAAARHFNIECLKYAHEHGAPLGITTCINAARNFNFDALEYAVAHGCPIDSDVCVFAMRCFSPAMVISMCQNKFPMHPAACRAAVGDTNVLRLRFLHEGGCPWNATTTRDASRVANLRTLKYAAEHGCPVEVVPCSCSVPPEHFKCMKYVYDNYDNTFNPIPAIIHDHHKCYRYAYENGCEWTEAAVVCAARLGKLEFLRFAYMPINCPYSSTIDNVYAAAVENEHAECVDFLDSLVEQHKAAIRFRRAANKQVRALRHFARRKKIRNINTLVAVFLHKLLIDNKLYVFFTEYLRTYDRGTIDCPAWRQPILAMRRLLFREICLHQDSQGLVHMRILILQRMCQMMLSPVNMRCIFLLKRLCELLKAHSTLKCRCKRKIRQLQRQRRRYGRFSVRRCFIPNVWIRVLHDVNTRRNP